jgi:ABC-type transport system involved in cytochrome c biogenesis permease subunit
LILFLLYLGVIALWRTVEDTSRAARAVAILTLVGAVDLPIMAAMRNEILRRRVRTLRLLQASAVG